jgi:hypothetical protein
LLANLLALALLMQHHADEVTVTSAPEAPVEDRHTPFFRRELPPFLRAIFPRLQTALTPPSLDPRPLLDDPVPFLKKKGLLVAKLAYGLYLELPHGGPALPFGEMLTPRVHVAQDRGTAKLPGSKLCLQASWYFLPSTGLSLEAHAGQGWFATLSFIHRW